MYLFDYEGHIHFRPANAQMLVSDPYFFFIDNSNILFISDYGSNSILIFNPFFEFIHEISVLYHPTGIVVDKQRRIIVVCQSNNDCLQIF